ncbi:MAG TPA: MerR family transcriptional regulator [Solirubrobacteraceae bacterium]|jgi:DNA-binding transcriptional MerR regulator
MVSVERRQHERAGTDPPAPSGEQPTPAQPEQRLTIDQLAQATGLTVRNVRNYQSRGLIPPPEVQGRVGYYGTEHLARLQLIRELQAQGFNLTAIAHVLEEARGSGEQVLGFTRSLIAPFETETPEIVERADLDRRLGGAVEPKLIAKAEKLGLVVAITENTYEVPSPTLLGAGERLVAFGVPLQAALDTMDQLKRNTHRIAQTFVQMFLEFIWKPFDDAGRPESEWPAVRAALDQLRPLASDALLAGFAPTMTKAVEVAFGRQLDRGRGRKS